MIPFANPPRPGLQEELRALRVAVHLAASAFAMVPFIRLTPVYRPASPV